MILKNFQIKAVDKLISKTLELLDQNEGKKIIFKSPTGSGKTIMMAEYLNRIVKDRISKNPVSFIWTTPRRNLTIQSKEKLDKFTIDMLVWKKVQKQTEQRNSILKLIEKRNILSPDFILPPDCSQASPQSPSSETYNEN